MPASRFLAPPARSSAAPWRTPSLTLQWPTATSAASATSIPPAAVSARPSATCSRRRCCRREHLDTGTDVWTGQINRFIALGGDLRYRRARRSGAGHQDHQLSSTSSRRASTSTANVIPIACWSTSTSRWPRAAALNREAWGMFWSADHTWYVKGGQMYLPFGLAPAGPERLRQHLRHRHGRPRTTASKSAGSRALGCTARREQRHRRRSDHQQRQAGERCSCSSSQSRWRAGVAANFNDSIRQRQPQRLCALRRTEDRARSPGSRRPISSTTRACRSAAASRSNSATLLEANYSPARGHNLKVTFEYLDPDRDVAQRPADALELRLRVHPHTVRAAARRGALQ